MQANYIAALTAEATDPIAQGNSRVARLLVAVPPDQNSQQLISQGKRLADMLRVDWGVVCVEPQTSPHRITPKRDQLSESFRFARSLGATCTILDGVRVADAIAAYAKLQQADRIVVGAPRRALWRWGKSTPSELIRLATEASIIVVPTNETARNKGDDNTFREPAPDNLGALISVSRYLRAVGLTGLCTAIAFPLFRYFDPVNIVMIYLLGATLAGLRLGRGPAALCAAANVVCFDFFFVPPRYSFYISESQYLVTMGAMLCIALVIANLMVSVRQQTDAACAREHRTALLYAMSRELVIAADIKEIVRIASRHISAVFESNAVVLPATVRGGQVVVEVEDEDVLEGLDRALVKWVVQNERNAGLGTNRSTDSTLLYVPLRGTQRIMGVLVVHPTEHSRLLLPDQGRLLELFTGQIALSLERAALAEMAEAAHVVAERAALRNTLLASLSHDLRAPLTAIASAGNIVSQTEYPLDNHRRMTLGRLVEEKARDMTTLLTNVLEMIRLESGLELLTADWHAVDELVGTALRYTQHRLSGYSVDVEIPLDLPEIHVDAPLVVQLFVNLLENALKYAPKGTHIEISATAEGDSVRLVVEDNGPGFGKRDPESLFGKFQRGRDESEVTGIGLGLAICRAIVTLHGGEIRAFNAIPSGARFEIVLRNQFLATKVEQAELNT
jgi:two-component system sensor histidine kinase KdpD